MCAMSPITLCRAWECVECWVTSMVTFPGPLLPGQQLRPAGPREEGEEEEEGRREKGSEEEEGAEWSECEKQERREEELRAGCKSKARTAE